MIGKRVDIYFIHASPLADVEVISHEDDIWIVRDHDGNEHCVMLFERMSPVIKPIETDLPF